MNVTWERYWQSYENEEGGAKAGERKEECEGDERSTEEEKLKGN